MGMSYNPKLISVDGSFRFMDNDGQSLKDRKVQRLLQRYRSYFSDFDNLILNYDIDYLQLTELVDKVNNKLDIPLEVSKEVKEFISQNRYAIEEQRIAGLTIKNYDERWNLELQDFERILNKELARPLFGQQVQASFYLKEMKKAANFSVPGSGKTAMMYGSFAYLSAPEINQVNRIVIVSPINAFESWRYEFDAVFQNKRKLNFMNLKDYTDAGKLRTDWGIANIIVINYEALQGWKFSVLNSLIDEKTMLVFDEVHRVKNPEGIRAKNSLELGRKARYRYVLTGTPIPNSYRDIFNFLHILYDTEYQTHFGWSIADLNHANPVEVNEKMQPFFWRTNKNDLNVPPAEPDRLIEAFPNSDQEKISEMIYQVEENVLGRYIRLMQASTNPALLTEKIKLDDLGLIMDEADFSFSSALDTKEQQIAKKRLYLDLNAEKIRTPKFDKGIHLIQKLVAEGKKVLVWGMFVGTMEKIQKELEQTGIKTNLIYGATPKDKRVDLIDEFRDGDTQVLVSNPATLGESISLHQTVHDAIYFEYNFNLTFMLQSRDRIHRLGLPENQYTRYYYLMTEGDVAHKGYIDRAIYQRLKEKEAVMLSAIDGELLVPMIEDDYLEDIKKILK